MPKINIVVQPGCTAVFPTRYTAKYIVDSIVWSKLRTDFLSFPRTRLSRNCCCAREQGSQCQKGATPEVQRADAVCPIFLVSNICAYVQDHASAATTYRWIYPFEINERFTGSYVTRRIRTYDINNQTTKMPCYLSVSDQPLSDGIR